MRPRPLLGPLLASIALVSQTACATFAFKPAPPSSPSAAPTPVAFSIRRAEPFTIAGRTAMHAGLLCPATFVEGIFGPGSDTKLVLREIWEMTLAPGAPAGCGDLTRGTIARDPSAPFVPVLTDHTHNIVTRSDVAVVAVLAVVVVAVLFASAWNRADWFGSASPPN